MGDQTRVDFYLLSRPGLEQRHRFACRLAEKAWQLGHRVYLHADGAAAARALDELLWTFRQDSFVPHGMDDGAVEPEDPVLVGDGREPASDLDVLINLGDDVPAWALRSRRVAEIVPADESSLAVGRERYRHYRSQGCDLHRHEV